MVNRSVLRFLVFALAFLISKSAFAYSCAVMAEPWITASESGQYTLIRLIKNGITKYELLDNGDPARQYQHDFSGLRFQTILNDGTFVGMESGGCGGSAIASRIHAIDVTGKLIFTTKAKELVEHSYLEQVRGANYYAGAQMPWLYGIEVVGNSRSNATIVVRLSNYDKVEITVADGVSRYIPVSDLGEDAESWSARASWFGFIGEREKQFEHYLRALELAPQDASVRSYLINHYQGENNHTKAQSLIEDALRLAPLVESGVEQLDSFSRKANTLGHPLYYQYKLAELHERKGERPKAVAALDEALDLNPNEWRFNLFKSELQLTEENREQTFKNIDSVFAYHLDYVRENEKDEAEKAAVIENYRESYGKWLSKNGFYAKAEELLLVVIEESGGERSYHKYIKQRTFLELAQNAKRRGDSAAELDYLIKAADHANSPYSLEEIAWRYVRGEGTEKDHIKALKWFKKAAGFRGGMAKYFPVCFLEYLSSENGRWNAAKKWCEKGVMEEEGNSAFWLAMMLSSDKRFLKKRITPNDLTEFNELLLLARKNNYPSYGRSERVDWDIYELSDDVSRFIPALKSIAEQGSFIAAYHLGQLYEHGIGADEDSSEALAWFEKAASAGDPQSQYEYGLGLLTSDADKAIQMLESAANADEPWAGYKLGELYYRGNLVDRDLGKMEYWLLKSDESMKRQYKSLYSRPNQETSAMKRLYEYRSSL